MSDIFRKFWAYNMYAIYEGYFGDILGIKIPDKQYEVSVHILWISSAYFEDIFRIFWAYIRNILRISLEIS